MMPPTQSELANRDKDPKSSYARARPFAETHWSLVMRAKDTNASAGEDALDHLCRTYWYPLYGFVRRQGYGPAAAQDLTQDFFARLVHRNCLEHVAQEKGKFRSFLLASLKNFLSNERARAGAEKRGGGCSFVSLDADEAEERFQAEPFHEATPEKAFDHNWAMTVLSQALTQLRDEYTESGKAQWFDALEPYLVGERDGVAYVQVAARLDTTETAVRMAVMRLRRRFGQVLRAHIGQTVTDETELNDELRYLFAALAP